MLSSDSKPDCQPVSGVFIASEVRINTQQWQRPSQSLSGCFGKTNFETPASRIHDAVNNLVLAKAAYKGGLWTLHLNFQQIMSFCVCQLLNCLSWFFVL